MLPPTRTLRPLERSRCPIKAVVVDLPLVPVTAMTGALHNRNATSISPSTGTTVFCTAITTAELSGTPGETPPREPAGDRFELIGVIKRAPVASTISIASCSSLTGFSSVA